ncbi:MAG: hypothetical protein COV31_00740 [Candidatus Yanofskybacteria bacterium CG10_big_fil_rev_8_21_14_0_10_46_23]|uniref:Uncharacterized protein n=1 Tax=Candidatus Yanofskybacteria bacterium CG10_big_fil_rev_8_21_14_0_10_46_23 TaxID=1975098 RepID=A0A2H0R517_9BACT|nr:MAG: hypothetical protein COV31_00740 [Candidatus Yanofskybacteria bacterium CG10_big_fil_rev_8_21_14_0_10_46_23]
MGAVTRLLKQLIFLIIFGLFIGLVFWGLSRLGDSGPIVLNTPPPILPLETQDSQIISVGADNDYDLLFRIRNPNVRLGASRVAYEVDLLDDRGNLVDKLTGQTYILPGQFRFLLISPVRTEVAISQARINFQVNRWQGFSELIAPEDIALVPTQGNFRRDHPSLFARYEGILRNNSDFDLATVDLIVLVRDSQNKIIATNRTNLQTVQARSNRDFTFDWAEPFSGSIERIEIEAYTNLLENDNFLKRYGSFENFQAF